MYTKKSMMFNGVYFEDEIEGYTTTGVSGRERAEVETTSLSVGNRDGAIFRNNRYKSRTLTINFVLEGDELDFNADETELINRMDKLNALLDVEDEVQIIFRDEPDKFYMGIPTGSASITRKLGIIEGSFQIFCSDPFKYSTEIFSATPIEDEEGYKTFVIDYEGTHKSYPSYEVQFYTQNRATALDSKANLTDANAADKIEELRNAIAEDADYEYWRDPDDPTKTVTDDEINQMVQAQITEQYPPDEDKTTTGVEDEAISGKGKCGYVAFFDDDENILQFGNPDAVNQTETIAYTKLISQDFKTINAWSPVINRDWVMNSVKCLPGIPKDSKSSYIYNETGGSSSYFSISDAYKNGQNYDLSTTFSAAGVSSKYTITCTAKNRKATSVDVSAKVSFKMSAQAPKARTLKASLTVGGTTKEYIFKKSTKKAWSKHHSGSFTLSYTISDLSSYKDTLDVKFSVSKSGGKGDTGKCTSKSYTLYIPIFITPKTTSYALMANPTAFVGTNKDQFYGTTAYRIIPDDVTGNKGWSDFESIFEVEMAMNTTGDNKKQRGAIYVGILTGDFSGGQLTNPKVLAGCAIQKATDGNTGIIYPVLNGKALSDKKISNIDLSYHNVTFGPVSYSVDKYKSVTKYKNVTKTVKSKKKKKKKKKKTYRKAYKSKEKIGSTTYYPDRKLLISKSGKSFTFTLGGKTMQVNDDSVANTKAYAVFMGCFGYAGHPYLPYQGILSVSFKPSGSISKTDYIPFTTGDFLFADAASGNVLLNSEERPDLGALGNDWEQMCLYPGVNQIGVIFSDWCGDDSDVAYRRQTGNDEFNASAKYYTKDTAGAYSPVTISEEQFNSNKPKYYILEHCVPSFTIKYREAYV